MVGKAVKRMSRERFPQFRERPRKKPVEESVVILDVCVGGNAVGKRLPAVVRREQDEHALHPGRKQAGIQHAGLAEGQEAELRDAFPREDGANTFGHGRFPPQKERPSMQNAWTVRFSP